MPDSEGPEEPPLDFPSDEPLSPVTRHAREGFFDFPLNGRVAT